MRIIQNIPLTARALALLIVASLALASGCVPMTGSPSLTMLSRDIDRNSPQIKVIGDKVTESDTFTWALFFLFVGPPTPSHEAALDRLLDKYNADLLVETDMNVTTYGVPYIFMQTKYKVTGYPARFVKGGR